MKLSAGDMVTVYLVDNAYLYGQAFEAFSPDDDPVSFLTAKDTAIIISLSNSDGRCVYVAGPHGTGWIFGAYLKRVK